MSTTGRDPKTVRYENWAVLAAFAVAFAWILLGEHDRAVLWLILARLWIIGRPS